MSCDGIERFPSTCRCSCEGCRHHCGACYGRNYCNQHREIEPLTPEAWAWCSYCGHVFVDKAEWQRYVEACPEPRITYDGTGCPLCFMIRQVVRQHDE